MAKKYRELASKAASGDRDAAVTLVLISPKGHMGDLSEEEYAKKLSEDDEFMGEFEDGAEDPDDEPEVDDDEFDQAYEDEHAEAIADLEECLSEFIEDEEECHKAAVACCRKLSPEED